uniref:Reverse transcriptase domain-containing protein n=1 Tax=Tanacetum cinerariifolium TaxID=118510 RepID=A0A6L2J1Z2_TANCI|nr:hypothetical protein [Tanacetum cinerariifolium]
MDNISMPLKSCLKASMIRNIKGNTIGKDGKPLCALRKPVRVRSHKENPNLVGDAIHVRVPLVHEENPNLMGDMILKDKMVQSDGAASKDGETGSDHQHGMKPMGTNLFASVLQAKPSKRVVKIMEFRNEESVKGAAVAIPFEAVEEVSSRFTNTLYGYFIGKRLAFRLVENYVKNTWAKYGLKRVQLHDDFFLFQFESKEVKKAPVWIKLHHIPIVAYLEVGLSLITTQLGKPIMLDSYTSSMCLSLWGKCTYARALIEVSAEKELMESLVIAIPVAANDMDEGFVEVKKKKHKNKVRPQQQIDDEEGKEDEMFNRFNEEAGGCFECIGIGLRMVLGVIRELVLLWARTIMMYNQRRSLWRSLTKHKVYVRDRPWCILGDFNAALFLEDSTASGSTTDIAMRDFRDCVKDIEVMDVQQIVEFNQAVLTEERFLKHKAKIQWLKEGDSNSAYFHKAVKSRVSRSRIDAVTNVKGVVFENNMLPDAFVSHYETFLGLAALEVKEVLFSIGDDKSPGPDGYTVAFFKDAWDVVANNVTNAICEFFRNGTLLKELNHTIIALISKVKSPTRVNDYRPISCCNLLFKCISKIIANRIKHSLKSLIRPNQSAFILGRTSTDNILLTQELMYNYHLDRGTPRFAFKVDIQKAYDTVDWDFLRVILHGFGFHDRMISWIMECVTTTSYSICVNGSLHGYFQGKRCLRQGDLLSPYLFTLVMEVLTLMLQRKVQELMIRDCNELIDRVQIRIQDWKNKTLSIAGRLQLIKSVLAREIFLWCHRNMGKGKSKVAWELLTLKESLWVKWIHEYKLNGRNFWDIPLCGNMSWGRRKILRLRPIIREFIWCKIRDGACTSLWFDRWCDLGAFASHISSRDMFRAGLNLKSKVKDVIHNGSWLWTHDLLVKYLFLSECHALIIDDNPDCLEWRNNQGITKTFSVTQVWSDIRTHDFKVDWMSRTLWALSVHCVMVLLIHMTIYFLTARLCMLFGIASSPPNIYDIIHDLLSIARRRTIKSVVAKLVAATAYFLWQERNWRLFNMGRRRHDQICDRIMSSVRLKILSCRLKKSKNGVRMARH